MTPTELSTWLTTNDPTPLPPEDRATLASALTELALSQAIIAKQALLLDSYNADHTAIESTLRSTLSTLTENNAADNAAASFDFEKARQARADLAAKLASAASLRSIIALGINLVRTVANR
jgi:ribonuclease HII